MQLEIKHVKGYLGTDVQCMSIKYAEAWWGFGFPEIPYLLEGEYKLILRPLSDLTKEIEHNGEKFVPIEWLEDKYYTLDLHKECKSILEDSRWLTTCSWLLIQHLQEWGFDIHNLIENGHAIDINTLK